MNDEGTVTAVLQVKIIPALPQWEALCHDLSGDTIDCLTHTHVCTAILVRTLFGIMHSLASYPNPNHPNKVPNPDP